jgi:hypothetical protein
MTYKSTFNVFYEDIIIKDMSGRGCMWASKPSLYNVATACGYSCPKDEKQQPIQ